MLLNRPEKLKNKKQLVKARDGLSAGYLIEIETMLNRSRQQLRFSQFRTA